MLKYYIKEGIYVKNNLLIAKNKLTEEQIKRELNNLSNDLINLIIAEVKCFSKLYISPDITLFIRNFLNNQDFQTTVINDLLINTKLIATLTEQTIYHQNPKYAIMHLNYIPYLLDIIEPETYLTK